jgi:hypothetical protein
LIRPKSSGGSSRKRKAKPETQRLRSDRTTFILGETAATQRMWLVRVSGGLCSNSHDGLCHRHRALAFRPFFSLGGNPYRHAPGTRATSFRRWRCASQSRASHESAARLVDDPESVPTLASPSDLRQLFVVRDRGLAFEDRRKRNGFRPLRRTSNLRRVCSLDGGPRLANILVASEKPSCRGEFMTGSFKRETGLSMLLHSPHESTHG